jgi:hypothetical protein
MGIAGYGWDGLRSAWLSIVFSLISGFDCLRGICANNDTIHRFTHLSLVLFELSCVR